MWNQTFTYDALGNINKDAGSGPGQSFMPVYDPAKNWITTLPGATPAPTTDMNGRMTWDGTHSYAWDAESKLVGVDISTSTEVTATYDAFGRMVEKNVGGVYTQIVYGPMGNKYAVMSGQTLQKAFIPLPTGAQAVYNSSGQLAYYRHSDHLGSSRLATTPNRTVYSSTAYAPFGETYAETGTRDRSFTGQDEDTTSGMYDFLARKYSPVQGRWLSPDPAGLGAVDPANPQTWNRYAYVGNNPLALIDPLGEDAYSGCSDQTPWCYYAYYGSIFFSGSSYIGYGNDVFDALVSGYWQKTVPGGIVAHCIDGVCSPGDDSPPKYEWVSTFPTLSAVPMLDGIPANNVATISAVPSAKKDFKKDYCSDKADQAALNSLMPGLGDVIYNYHNVDVPQKLTSGALQSFFGFGGTLQGIAMTRVQKSDMALHKVRSATGIPKTLFGSALKHLGWGTTAYNAIKALGASRSEFKACMDYMNSY